MKVLITGGAGFIGSNLTEHLLNDDRITEVRVFDNLSTGLFKNISGFIENPKFVWIEGDIRDFNSCIEASKGVDAILHQAALGSVPRSINDPLTTNAVNISGTLNIFTAAKDNGISKIIYAASSSTYGDSKSLPKIENVIGKPLSPYAVTKLVNELYADVFNQLFGINFIGLRYFNVFGPKQSPTGAYAAVIPLFANAVLNNQSPCINGNGEQSRDFTFVANAVQANVKALFCEDKAAWNQVYNVACGEQHTINQLFNAIKKCTLNTSIEPTYREARVGDIADSLADISKAKTLLNYNPEITLAQGLEITLSWYKNNNGYF